MTTWTRVGLVLLRIVIGWHFLFEGVSKLETWHYGPREGKPAWSAAGYLSESQGPLAPWFRGQVGEPDADAIAKLTLLPNEPGRLPFSIDVEWQSQFDRFAKHYNLGGDLALQPEYVGCWAVAPSSSFLTVVPWPALARSFSALPVPPAKPDQPQAHFAVADLKLARAKALEWFTSGSREVPSKLPGVAEKVKETTPERIALYKKKLEQLDEIEGKGMPAFDHDVWKDNYRTLKKEIATMRVELLRDLSKPFDDTMAVAKFRLSKAQRDKGPVPEPPVPSTNLDRINVVTSYGLTIVGACLMLGLFTRPACVAGAAFLLMFYLAMPALPWLPANPRAEGHYQFIDKNIIEMIALLALATTPSGRWLGLDALLYSLNPWRGRQLSSRGPKDRVLATK